MLIPKIPYIGMFWDIVFSPILSLSPALSLALISFLISLTVVIASKIVMRMSNLENIRQKIEEIRNEIFRLQKEGKEEMAKKQMEELLKINKSYMFQSFKLILVSLVIFILIFPWIAERYQSYSKIVKLPFALPFIGDGLNWLEWYILISFVVGFILKKIIE
ncbi:MAG: hypothetical protein B6U78_01485 [Candidatus Aenigmarchaeota archaeon ex4484_224]|nr:MAG: hypothetical protein B6U78_01485 [Candidatus Aenigmarchaeota archaeon ex4484_224]